jgi:multidrug efflux pump subunit AcrB
MTIVAVFAPVSFMSGIAGQYFRQFGLTVSVAVLFSLLVARFITPVMAAYFMRSHHAHEEKDGPVLRAYTHVVSWSLRHRWITLAAGIALFVGSIASTKLLPSGFIPAEDIARTLLAVELPPGSRLEDTDTATRKIAEHIKELPEVRSVLVFGGQILGGASEVRKATIVVNLVHKSKRSVSQKDVEVEIAHSIADLPDLRFWFLRDNGQRDLQLIVAGTDMKAINDTANQLASEMARLPMLKGAISTAELDRPELQIAPRTQLAADLGVSTEALSETIRVATIGDIDANLAKFDAGNRLIPIRVELPLDARSDLELLKALRVATAAGGAVPLDAVSQFEMGRGPTAINRYDRARRVTVEADLTGDGALGEATAAIYALPTAQNLPPGVTLREFGDVEVMQEVFASFGAAMGAGMMMVFGVLILLFGSFGQPVTILFSLPLSIGGAILALLVTGRPISMPVVIGILMLMGIVTKNAIMLVDMAIEEMRHGRTRIDALVEAGRKRARPIVMTTIAMVAGMFPSALAFGDGGAFRSPMAIAVIGGLLISTALSLLFVPAVFTLLDDLGALSWRLFSRVLSLEGDKEGPATEQVARDAAPAH